MKSRKGIFGLCAMLAAIALFLGGLGVKALPAAADEVKSFTTGANILEQGQNGFYYAWGTPKNYVIMEYGPTWGGNSEGWHGLEGYQTVTGSTLHPGNFWGVMIVWVADESGKVALKGQLQKGASNGDGANLGVYHQNYGGELVALYEKFTRAQENFDVEAEVEVKVGDTLIFYCDSGRAKDNNSDSCGAPFTITYTERKGDVDGGDLSKYLNAGRPGDVGGFTHVEQGFKAEVLDGTLTEKTVVTTEGGCASSIASPAFAGIMLVAAFALRRKRR